MDSIVILSDSWVVIVGALLPLVSAAAVRPEGSNGLRAAIAVVASGIVAVIVMATDGMPDTMGALIGAFLTAAVSAYLSYGLVLRHQNVNTRVLPKIGFKA